MCTPLQNNCTCLRHFSVVLLNNSVPSCRKHCDTRRVPRAWPLAAFINRHPSLHGGRFTHISPQTLRLMCYALLPVGAVIAHQCPHPYRIWILLPFLLFDILQCSAHKLNGTWPHRNMLIRTSELQTGTFSPHSSYVLLCVCTLSYALLLGWGAEHPSPVLQQAA